MKVCKPRKQHGQALTEFAFILPFILLLLLGVIELGRYAYISILIGNAARAGAAYGAQGNGFSIDTTGIANAAKYDFAGATSGSTSLNGQPSTALSVTSSTSCGCDSAGTITSAGCTTATNPTPGTCTSGGWVVMVSVTASGTFNALFNYPGIPTSLTISRTAVLRVA